MPGLTSSSPPTAREPSGLGRHMLTLARGLAAAHRVTLAFPEPAGRLCRGRPRRRPRGGDVRRRRRPPRGGAARPPPRPCRHRLGGPCPHRRRCRRGPARGPHRAPALARHRSRPGRRLRRRRAGGRRGHRRLRRRRRDLGAGPRAPGAAGPARGDPERHRAACRRSRPRRDPRGARPFPRRAPAPLRRPLHAAEGPAHADPARSAASTARTCVLAGDGPERRRLRGRGRRRPPASASSASATTSAT